MPGIAIKPQKDKKQEKRIIFENNILKNYLNVKQKKGKKNIFFSLYVQLSVSLPGFNIPVSTRPTGTVPIPPIL